MQNGMTNSQYDALLELIAQYIESAATSIAEAAQIVRNAKTK